MSGTDQAALAEFLGGDTVASSEDEAAEFFAAFHRGEFCYCDEWGFWLRWDGTRWARDQTRAVFDQVRLRNRIFAGSGDAKKRPSLGRQLASSKGVSAVERLARGHRAFARRSVDFDSEQWAICTPGGIVDLTDGTISPADPARGFTRCTAVALDERPPTLFLRVLDRITGGDAGLQGYLQRLAGVCLTGSVRDHFFCFIWGLGANGKSTFLQTLAGVLGDYAVNAPFDLFVEAKGERHPTELALLRGARLAISQESEPGRPWAAARIKALTGGDLISARYMRGDFFTFEPHAKLLLAGNHKPPLRAVDEGIRRRLHLVPFDQVIPPDERDPELVEKLRNEWGAILGWALQGCLDWQAMGRIDPPARVVEATDSYLEAEDVLGAWIEDCCERVEASVATGALHHSYHGWAERTGERFLGMKRFAQALEERGFQRQRTAKARGFIGLRLKQESQPPLPFGVTDDAK